ncbi:hypothetical protein NUW58_g9955 [Xylaria curta]|uniref:Uncharacterized protein n=1 Tax=Xylaria curta TaxID=42375 RepID=A0ACC1MSC2_9PEZI|nr:hypothetical protein NUW58_g9955 [Xylaria curta]
MHWVLGVYGAWAILSGLMQLGAAVRRWRTAGAQWAQILSGAQSSLAGGFFIFQATQPEEPSIKNIAGYAAFGAFYFLLVVALIGIAIYVQVTSSTLSLPISTATTVLTILLPLFAAANIIYTPVSQRLARSSALQQFLLPALHILQGGLAVVIATLAAQGFVPGKTQGCVLPEAWQLLWHNHDHRAIERIQNAFDCCGFHSVVDRAWPDHTCPTVYDRHTPCDGLWRGSMQRTSALQFAVAVLAGIIQLAHLAYLRRRGVGGSIAEDFKRFRQPAGEDRSERLIEEPYHDDDDEEVSVDQSASPPALLDNQDNTPRVQPSGLGRDEANEWRS